MTCVEIEIKYESRDNEISYHFPSLVYLSVCQKWHSPMGEQKCFIPFFLTCHNHDVVCSGDAVWFIPIIFLMGEKTTRDKFIKWNSTQIIYRRKKKIK